MKNFNCFKLNNSGKRFLIQVILIIVFFAMAFIEEALSQEIQNSSVSSWKLNSIDLSTGETPLSSGLNVDILVSKGKNSFFLSYNKTLGQIIYEIPLTDWCSIQPTGGIYHNLPWAGPLLTFKMFNNHFITNHWFGWSAGVPEVTGTSLKETIFLFSFQEFKYTSKKMDAYYVLEHYMKNSPMHLFGMKKKFFLGEDKAVYSSITYVHPDNRFLWAVGFAVTFNN